MGDDVDHTDIGFLGQKTRGDSAERGRNLAVQMGLTAIFGLERVEDPVLGVTQLEGIPTDGADLRGSQGTAFLEKASQFGSLTWLSIEQGEQPDFLGHQSLLSLLKPATMR